MNCGTRKATRCVKYFTSLKNVTGKATRSGNYFTILKYGTRKATRPVKYLNPCETLSVYSIHLCICQSSWYAHFGLAMLLYTFLCNAYGFHFDSTFNISWWKWRDCLLQWVMKSWRKNHFVAQWLVKAVQNIQIIKLTKIFTTPRSFTMSVNLVPGNYS